MSQGATTVVVGNCGISLSPVRMAKRPIPPLDLLGDESWWTFDSFGAYADRLTRDPSPVNTYALIGHMSLRVEAMDGDVDRAATDREAEHMRRRLADALAEGASGFSTGLYYPPNAGAPTEEVIAVAQALRDAGGIYVTHMRDEGAGVLDSIEETLRIGRGTDSPVVISHHKCAMPENYGRSVETLPAIDRAAAHQRVDFDMYPYAAGSTVLMVDKIRDDVRVQVTWSVPHPEMSGRDLEAIAADWGVTRRQAAAQLLPAGAIYFQMQEDDVRRIMSHRLAMIGSDGLPHDAYPHPRLWGTFPRVLGHYSRDLGLFSMETAVHKMTGRTADVFGITDRGVIRAGAYADLVLFDPRDRDRLRRLRLPHAAQRGHPRDLGQRPVRLRLWRRGHTRQGRAGGVTEPIVTFRPRSCGLSVSHPPYPLQNVTLLLMVAPFGTAEPRITA